ncbi:MAG: hypothetical protein EBZ47_08815 [Chlamydiae bacterium]|nr:hypothetical protein [Chlamydiota bacterium]
MQLIIASTNSHKIREFKTLLKGFKSLDLRTLKDFPNYTPLERFLDDGVIKKVAKGFCEGTLTVEPRGSYGFSYDSLFIKHDYRKTFAEIEDETRIKISYRIKAFDKIRLSLESLFL